MDKGQGFKGHWPRAFARLLHSDFQVYNSRIEYMIDTFDVLSTVCGDILHVIVANTSIFNTSQRKALPFFPSNVPR